MSRREISRRSFVTLLASVPIWYSLRSGLLWGATLRVRREPRFWSAPDHTRLVLELDAPARFETRTYHDPERIVIEIPGAEMAGPPLDLALGDGLVRRIYTRQMTATLLVGVELERAAASYAAFPLAPNAASGTHRIVLDIRKQLTEEERRAQDRETEAVRESGDTVVVIDPGHGGNDPGCISPDGRVVESRLALVMARQLAAALGQQPRMRPVLTRERDYFVPLAQRPRVAQRFGAQLFVSIHANSASSREARGAEIYFVSLQGAADKAAKELVDRENASDLVGGLAPEQVRTPLVDILVNLKQNNTIRRSERLGELMLQRVEQVPGMEIRGLKQGPLAVLKSIASPSVLVELGFVTNARDARLLLDGKRQRQYAQQLAAGIQDYRNET